MATKKEKVLAVIAVIAGVILWFGFVGGIVYFFLESGLYSHYETDDISEYGIYEGHTEMEAEELFSCRSLLMIFPKEIKDSYKVNQYYYSCGSAGFDNMYQMVLDYELPEDEFEAEVERLSQLSVEYKNKTKSIVYDTDNFEYPAYVTCFTKHSDYEYALIDEENHRIVCILSCIEDINRLPVNKKYLPKDEDAYADAEGWYGYSMYHFYDGSNVNNAAVMMAE